MSPRRAPAWEPNADELLLLRAGLWPGERGLAAWRQWRRGAADLEAVEAGSQRLLPLAYLNLGELLSGDPDAERLRSVYRYSWAVNQLSMRIGRQAVEAIQAEGIEAMALKGAALIGSAYRDGGARPMGDCDLAVHPDRVPQAVSALQAAGFTPGEAEPERRLEVRHSLEFKHPDGLEVDLHRSVLWRPGLEEEFWRGSVELELAGATVRALCPADQLLHVCVHGAAWNPMRPIRWTADAYKVIEAAGDGLDWERLVRIAARGRLTLPLADALAYLARELEAPVPDDSLRALAEAPVSGLERRAHAALSRPPSPQRSLAMLWWFWEGHRARAAADGVRPGPSAFLRHLRDFWGLDRPSQVPSFAMRRLLRRRA